MQGLRTALTNGHYYLTETGCMPVQLIRNWMHACTTQRGYVKT